MSIPDRPWDAGQVAFTNVVLSVGPPLGNARPGYKVASRLLTQTLWEVTRSSTVPEGFIQNTSFTNFWVEV